ncbi:hypothetical protein SRABI36_01188 [Pedobacter sp. Bi36]|nr:hypothetical protein SRABI36_01188 [Pedobacter sp. Bi36]CAH0223792.1 hypothetical protein SRABI126_02280 [Pedobacter sp. Bi126]
MTHSAIQSKDYIKNIDFEYVETYSFQQQAYYSDTTRNTGAISWYDNRITDLNGNLDNTSEKISSFQRNSQDVIKLNHILETEVANLPSWMCLPITGMQSYFIIRLEKLFLLLMYVSNAHTWRMIKGLILMQTNLHTAC